MAHRKFLFAFARSRLHRSREDAEDLAQFVMLKAWEHRAAFRPGSNMKAWLFTILRNGHFSQMRRLGVHNPISATIGNEEGDSVVHDMAVPGNQEDAADLRDILEAFSKLPLHQIDSLLLIARGHSYEKIADNVCCAVGTVKSRVARARKTLRKACG